MSGRRSVVFSRRLWISTGWCARSSTPRWKLRLHATLWAASTGLGPSPNRLRCQRLEYVAILDSVLLTRTLKAKVLLLEKSFGSGAVFAGPVSRRRAVPPGDVRG